MTETTKHLNSGVSISAGSQHRSEEPVSAAVYGEALYGFFKADFLDSLPLWPDKRVGLKRLPLMRGKEATFWHFLTNGHDEEARQIDFLRCERIRWPRPVMEAFSNRKPTPADRVVWWKN